MIKKESAIYGQISDEEWEAIRLTKKERRDGMLEIIAVKLICSLLQKTFKTNSCIFDVRQDHLSHKQKCSSCCRWDFLATETWGSGYIDSGI